MPDVLPPTAIEKAAEEQHTALINASANASDIIANIWGMTMTDLTDASADKFVATASAALDDLCEQVARSQVNWLEDLENVPFGTTTIDYGSIVSQIRGGTSSADLMRRAVIAARSGKGDGVSLTEALLVGRQRARNYAQTSATYSHRVASQQYVRSNKDSNITGWRRRPNPGACVFCLVASTQPYKRDDLLPMHPKCLCMTVPMIGKRRNPEDFLTNHQRAQLEKLKEDDGVTVKTVYTKELGPTLVSGKSAVPTGAVSATAPAQEEKFKNPHPSVEGVKTATIAPGLTVAMKNPGQALKAVKVAASAPGMGKFAPHGDKDDLLFVKQWHKDMVEEFSDRLVELYNRVPQEVRDKAKNWYRVAHGLGVKWAEEFNIHPDTAFAVIARLSPSTEWLQNLTMAKQVIRLYQDTERIVTAGDIYRWNYVLQTSQGAVPHWAEGMSLQQVAARDTRVAAMLVRAMADRDDNDQGKALFVRDENDKLVLSKGTKNKPGEPMSVRWQSIENLQAAMEILKDPSYQSVSHQLGHGHKIRSFFNNIRTPSDDYHVTVDTHAIGILFRIPWAATSKVMKRIMSEPKGTGKDSNDMVGMYWIAADAYRDAAARVGLLPNEMQAVVWEYWRMMWPRSARNSTAVAMCENILKAADSGKITMSEAIDLVEELRLHSPGALGSKKGVNYHSKGPDGLPEELRKYHPQNYGKEPAAAVEDQNPYPVAPSKPTAREAVNERLQKFNLLDRYAARVFSIHAGQPAGAVRPENVRSLAEQEARKLLIIDEDKITDKQRSALSRYQGIGYVDMNTSLRKPKSWKAILDDVENNSGAASRKARNDLVRDRVRELDSLVRESVATEPVTLYRGMSFEYKARAGARLLPLMTPGRIFRDPGFLSTSVNPWSAAQFTSGSYPTIIRYIVPEGNPALFLNDLSSQITTEQEVLLPPNSRFRVVENAEVLVPVAKDPDDLDLRDLSAKNLKNRSTVRIITLEVLPDLGIPAGTVMTTDDLLEPDL